MKDILYFNTLEDIKIVDMLRTTSKEKELPNQIILTIQSAGTGEVTPVFLKNKSGISIASIDEIGTKFILDGKEITSDNFQLIEGKVSYFGLQFEDSNEHTLKVSLVDSTINQNTFESNEYLTKVTIGTSITSIGNYAFSNCSGLTSITSLAITAPTITASTFQDIKTNGTLHVPTGSNYSTWMSTSNYYLGKYNWTKVEDA